jgi:hypothetical protein
VVLPLLSILVGETHLFVLCVQVEGAAWWVAMWIMARVGDLVRRTGDG